MAQIQKLNERCIMLKIKKCNLLPSRLVAILVVLFTLTACSISGVRVNDSLRYADKRQFDNDIATLKKLEDMKRGEACTWNFLFLIPVYGDGSLLTAAKAGQINDVELIAEYGVWRFPFNKECTVVYGDSIDSVEPLVPDSNNSTVDEQVVKALTSDAEANPVRMFWH